MRITGEIPLIKYPLHKIPQLALVISDTSKGRKKKRKKRKEKKKG